jgi:hypothetical protein
MSVETRTAPIVVRIPRSFGLSEDQITTLEQKWKADLVAAVEDSAAKLHVKWHINVGIEIGND